MNAHQKAQKHEKRMAHAERRDNRRPKGSELLSTTRKRTKAERKKDK